jgi:hypothetical protein
MELQNIEEGRIQSWIPSEMPSARPELGVCRIVL